MTRSRWRLPKPRCYQGRNKECAGDVLEWTRGGRQSLFENMWGGFGECLRVTLEHTQGDNKQMGAFSARMLSSKH